MVREGEICSLCGLKLVSHSIVDGFHRFCCRGCQVVFQILSTKNQLENLREQPIFQQAVQAGLISNPDFLQQIQSTSSESDEEKHKIYLEIREMWCPSCAEVIKLLLLREKGIYQCVVDYTTDLASIEFFPQKISKERICQLITRFGYQPVALENEGQKSVSRSLSLRCIVASFFSINIMMFAYPLYATYFAYDDQKIGFLFAYLSFFASLPVLLYSGYPIATRFYYSLKAGFMGMETLVVLGVSSAFGLSVYELLHGGIKVYFDSMTVIIAFVLIGKVVEAKAKFSAKDSLLRLSKSLPKKGRKRFSDGQEAFVPIKEILPGDDIIVLTGEKVVLDGIVLDGQGSCDESLINGESMPVLKTEGAFVLGGSLLAQGRLCYRVTSTKEESSLQKIVAMVEEEVGQKTDQTRLTDQIVGWFVPFVMSIAALSAIGALLTTQDSGEAIIRAISVLLISCPCAIGIAVPLAEAHLLNALAKQGVIVRHRGCLPLLGNETVFVFDKTGTLTEGKFLVLRGLDHLSGKQRAILKGLSGASIHPIALAIHRTIAEVPVKFDRVEEFAGKGMKGLFEGKNYYLGSEKFLREEGISISVVLSEAREGITQVFFNETPIILGDRLKAEATTVLPSLYPAKLILLSGDSQSAVESIAKVCGFHSHFWGMSPLEKKQCIEELRKENEIVCMLGDGVNDAPALAAAHVGISVVSATDISIQISDILLTTHRLDVISEMRRLGKKGQRIVKQNLFWAFFYNLIGIGLAATGYLSPIFSAFAMAVSSLTVTLNAQRLPLQSDLSRLSRNHCFKSLFKRIYRKTVRDDGF